MQELRRFLRKIKRANPERSCFLEYDKLYVDHKVYVYSEALGQVRGGDHSNVSIVASGNLVLSLLVHIYILNCWGREFPAVFLNFF